MNLLNKAYGNTERNWDNNQTEHNYAENGRDTINSQTE